jgi:hypothetical protein
VVGGLLVSTLLSLVFVPSFYTIMDDAAIGTARLFRWLVNPNQADEPDTEQGATVHVLPQREEFPVAAE